MTNEKTAPPNMWRMIDELEAAGWTAKTRSIWKSPTGKLYGGVASAWNAMVAAR